MQINALDSNVSPVASIGEDNEAIKKAVRQFESLFLHMMLKSMREGEEVWREDNIFSSQDSGLYESFYDEELSKHLSSKGALGISDILIKQLWPSKTDALIDKSLLSPIHSEISLPNFNDLKVDEQFTQLSEEKEQFVNNILPYAKEAAQKLNLDPKILIAQAALETGWGKFITQKTNGASSYNLFNIKADRNWSGNSIEKSTLEFKDNTPIKENAKFRSYASYQESFSDYVDFIQDNPRYEKALQVSHNPSQFVGALQKAGYATDPNYAHKIEQIYQQLTG